MIAIVVASILFANQLGTCIANPEIPLSWFLPEVQTICVAFRPAPDTGSWIIPPSL